MARPFGGHAGMEAARKARDEAKTAQELREALAVLLPLEVGLNLSKTAQVLGRSERAICDMRTRFCTHARSGDCAPRKAGKRHLRNRAKSTLKEESVALEKALKHAEKGQVLTIPTLKKKIEKALGHEVSLAGAYRMLSRHGWRKIAPDTQHPKGDVQVRDAWKKNSARRWTRVEKS